MFQVRSVYLRRVRRFLLNDLADYHGNCVREHGLRQKMYPVIVLQGVICLQRGLRGAESDVRVEESPGGELVRCALHCE